MTGGAGCIGTNYVYTHLEARPEDELTVLDALTYSGHRENLAAAEARGVLFIEGHIEDRDLVRALFERGQLDAVLNFAAETHVDRSIKDPALFVTTNVLGTQTLLDAARDFGVKRFHHISTDEVYGDLGFGSTDLFTEESLVRPSSPYSAGKASADLIAGSYWKTYNTPVIIARSSNNFGPYQYPEKLIPLFITNILEDKKVPLYGDGLNIRDWIYVSDSCEAIDFILHNGILGEIYNIGAGNEKTNIEITKIILAELGKDEEFIEYVKDRAGHDRRYSLNCQKVNKLGWKPKFKFESALKETIGLYKENMQWWKKIKSGAYLEYYKNHYKETHGMKW